MQKITDQNELFMIIGGFNISGAIINAFTSAGKFILDAGRYLGTAIRRISSRNICQCS